VNGWVLEKIMKFHKTTFLARSFCNCPWIFIAASFRRNTECCNRLQDFSAS